MIEKYVETEEQIKEALERVHSNFKGVIELGSTEKDISNYLNNNDKLHCFKISMPLKPDGSIFADVETLYETCKDLAEMNLLRLPFPAQYIEVSLILNDNSEFYSEVHSTKLFFLARDWFGRDPLKDNIVFPMPDKVFISDVCFMGQSLEIHLKTRKTDVYVDDKYQETQYYEPKAIFNLQQSCNYGLMTLLTFLATKNYVRQTSINKRTSNPKHTKSKFKGPLNQIYLSVTSVSAPMMKSRDGMFKRAHLRRGHIHTFAAGVGRTERIKKWVEPMFVNADEEFVAQARNYVVKP